MFTPEEIDSIQLKDLKFNVGDYWVDASGNVALIDKYGGGLWPWEAIMIYVTPEGEAEFGADDTDRYTSYMDNGIYSSSGAKDKYMLVKKIIKEENPEYFL